MAIQVLTTREIQTARDGDHSDGGGLLLRVRGQSSSWVFRYTAATGKRREMGLGVARRGTPAQAGESLTSARKAAQKARDQLAEGVDPIDDRERRAEALKKSETDRKAKKAREHLTLGRAARAYHERVIEPRLSAKHAAQWLSSLENHLPLELWNKPIADIDGPELLAALHNVKPHARARNMKGDRVPETLQRIRQRLDAIFEDAIFHKQCESNPAAAIRRKMREELPAKKPGNFKALRYSEAPAFMARLRVAEGVAARCLEFSVLTAARTSEALFAEWREFDLDAGVWVVPAERMKAGEDHIVYLSQRVLQILHMQGGLHQSLVFPSLVAEDKPMSNMAMLAVLGRLGMRDKTTVHGLCRATFSTWANDTAAARPDVIEACLAHKEADRVKAAYNRAQFNDERKALMAAWADYLGRSAQVLPLKAA
jgi:integrase